MAGATGAAEKRGNRNSLLVLGRLRSQTKYQAQKIQHHTTIFIQMFGAVERRKSIQRAEGHERRSAHVRQRGYHHTASLHVLRLDRHQSERQKWPLVQVRLPRRHSSAKRCQRRKRRNTRRQSDTSKLVRETQAHISRISMGSLRPRKEMG